MLLNNLIFRRATNKSEAAVTYRCGMTAGVTLIFKHREDTAAQWKLMKRFKNHIWAAVAYSCSSTSYRCGDHQAAATAALLSASQPARCAVLLCCSIKHPEHVIKQASCLGMDRWHSTCAQFAPIGFTSHWPAPWCADRPGRTQQSGCGIIPETYAVLSQWA